MPPVAVVAWTLPTSGLHNTLKVTTAGLPVRTSTVRDADPPSAQLMARPLSVTLC